MRMMSSGIYSNKLLKKNYHMVKIVQEKTSPKVAIKLVCIPIELLFGPFEFKVFGYFYW